MEVTDTTKEAEPEKTYPSEIEHLRLSLAICEMENRDLADLVSRQQKEISEIEDELFGDNNANEPEEKGESSDAIQTTSSAKPCDTRKSTLRRSGTGKVRDAIRNRIIAEVTDSLYDAKETLTDNLGLIIELREARDMLSRKNSQAAVSSAPAQAPVLAELKQTVVTKVHSEPPSGLSENASDVEKLRARNLELSAELSRQSTEIAELHWKVMEMEKERTQLIDKQKLAGGGGEDSRNRAQPDSKLASDLAETSRKLRDCESKIQYLRNSLQEVEKENLQLRHSIQLAETHSHRMDEEIRKLKHDRMDYENHVQTLLKEEPMSDTESKKALALAKKEIMRLSEELSASQKNSQRLNESLTLVGAQLAKQASLMGEIEWRLKEANTNYNASIERVKAAEEAKSNLESKLREVHEQHRTLSLAAKGSMIPVPATSSTPASTSLVESQKAYDEALQKQVKNSEEALKKLKAEYEAAKKELVSYKAEASKASAEIDTLKSKLTEQESKVGLTKETFLTVASELSLEGSGVDPRLKELQSLVEKLKAEKEVMQNSLTTLGAELSALSTRKGESDWTIRELTSERTKLANANERLNADLAEAREMAKSSEERLQRLQKKFEKSDKGGIGRELSEQLSESRKKQIEMEQVIKNLRQEIKGYTDEIQNLRNTIAATSAERSRMEKRLADSTSDLSRRISSSFSESRPKSKGSISGSSEKFYSASDVRVKPTISVECDVDKSTYYETVIADLEEKVHFILMELEVERKVSENLQNEVNQLRGSTHSGPKVDNSTRAAIFSQAPTEDSDATRRLKNRIEDLSDEVAKLQEELKASEDNRKEAVAEAKILRARIEGGTENPDLSEEVERAKTAEAEARAAMEAMKIEVQSKRRILQVLKQAADAERRAPSILPRDGNETQDLGSCEFLLTSLSRTSELESKIQSLMKENIALQEGKAHLQAKIKDAEIENSKLLKDIHLAESAQVKFFEEKASLSERVAQLQNHVSKLQQAVKESQALKVQDGKEQGKERRLSFIKKSRRNSQAADDLNEMEEKVRVLQAEKADLEKESAITAQKAAEAHKEAAFLKGRLVETERSLRATAKEFKKRLEEAEEVTRAMEASHAEVEEYLKSQVQELTDRLMEPISYPPPQALMEDLKAAQDQARELQQKCDALSKKLSAAESENTSLQNSGKSLQQEMASIQEKYTRDLTKLNDIVQAAQQLVRNLSSNGDVSADVAEGTIDQLNRVKHEIERFSGIVSATEEHYSAITAQNVQLIRDLSRTREELREQQSTAGDLSTGTQESSNMKELQEKTQKQKLRIKELESRLEQLKKSSSKEKADLLERAKEMERALISARLQIGSLGADLDKTKDELAQKTSKPERKKSLNGAKGARSRNSSVDFSGNENQVSPVKVVVPGDTETKVDVSRYEVHLKEAKAKARSIGVGTMKVLQSVKAIIRKEVPKSVPYEDTDSKFTRPSGVPELEADLTELVFAMTRASENLVAIGDDLSSFMGETANNDFKWKNIESALRSEKNELSSRLQDLEALLSKAQRRVTELESEKAQIESKAHAALVAQHESQARLDEGRETRTDLQIKVKNLMEERSQSRKTIEAQLAQLAELEAQVNKLETERAERQKETESLHRELARVRVEMEEIEAIRRRRIEELEVEINKSSNSLARDELRLINAESELAAARAEVSALTLKLSELNAEAQRSRDRYIDTCRSNGELERNLALAKSELASRETAISDYEARQKRLEAQLDNKEQELKSVRDEKGVLSTRVSDLEQMVQSLRGAEAEKTGDAKQLSIRVSMLESSLKAERETLSGLREDLQKKERDLIVLQRKVETQERREKELDARARDQAKQFDAEKSQIIQDVADLKVKLLNAETERKQAQEQCAAEESARRELEELLAAAKDKVTSLESICGELQRSMDEEASQRSILESQKDSLTAQLERTLQQMSSLQDQLNQIRENLRVTKKSNDEMANTIGDLTEKLRFVEGMLQSTTEKSQRRSREMDERLESSLSEIRKLQANLEEAKKETEELRESLREQSEATGGEVQQLSNTVLTQREKISQLESKLVEAEERVKLAEISQESNKKEYERLSQHLLRVEEAKHRLEAESQSLQSRLQSKAKDFDRLIADMTANLSSLQSRLNDADKAAADKNEELSLLQSQLAAAMKSISDKERTLSQLQSDHAQQLSDKDAALALLRSKQADSERTVLELREARIQLAAERDKLESAKNTELQHAHGRVKALEADLHDSRVRYDAIKEKADVDAAALGAKLSEYQARLASLGNSREVELIELRAASEREAAQLRAKLEARKGEAKELEKRAAELREDYEQKLTRSAKEIGQLKAELAEAGRRLELALREQAEASRKEIEKHRAERDEMKLGRDEAEQKHRDLLTTVSDLKQKLSKARSDLSSLQDSSTSDKSKAVKSLEMDVNKLYQEKRKLEIENLKFQKEAEEANARCQGLVRDLDLLRVEMKSIQLQMNNLQVNPPASWKRSRSNSTSAVAGSPRNSEASPRERRLSQAPSPLSRRNSSVPDLDELVADLKLKVNSREEEIAEVRRWLAEAEAEIEVLQEKLDRVDGERVEALIKLDELATAVKRDPSGAKDAMSRESSKIFIDTKSLRRRISTADSPTTAVYSPGEVILERENTGKTVEIDEASLKYLQRMSVQMILCFIVVFAPMTVLNVAGGDVPQLFRITSQVMGGVTGAIILNRPRKSLQMEPHNAASLVT
ncbi:hypothetical protein HDU96_009424 [Phlyctochytrium bullatum]|nr:hypothetical protein HDU96_009424 [Phlyctochytrium bullatum]